MAAFRPDLTVAGVGAARTIEHNPAALPEGACNYRALDRGTKAPVCGCKRFWLDSSRNESADSVWCFCGHHGCFHNSTPVQSQRLSTQTSVSIHHETSPKHVARQTPEGYVAVKQMGALPVPTGLGIRHESKSQSQSINTRVWDALNGFARRQLEGGHSGHTSQLPSTAASVIGDPVEYRSMAPPISIPAMLVTRPGMEDYQGSATEVATPSMAGTPDPQGFLPPGTQAKCSPQRAQVTSPVRSLLRDSGHVTQTQFSATTHSTEIMNMLKSHADRLNALEGLSFSHVPVEEVQDKFEVFDGRLLDIEQWRQETEAKAKKLKKTLARERRLLPNEACSFASEESFDMAAAAHAEAAVLATIAASSEIGPRIDLLEGRISDLEQAALPSYNTPWQVEVVLLPWGRNLRGIWFPSLKSKQTQADTDEWTGAVSQVKTSFASASSDAWTTESIQAWADNAHDWKSPKACGPNNVVYQRLASRGLIREVAFTATDSRHILDVLTAAFKHVLPARAIEADSTYQGLRTPFIPLRKVRKSTRLRFLGKAEMVTSATWSASFLDSSVFMKVNAGHRRLYITTPQAYMQTHDAGFTWQQLKSLPQRDSNGDEPAGQIDSSVAIEACWSYNDVLDQAPSLHSSFASQSQAAWSTHSASSTPDEAPGQLTPALSGPERPHKRTLSLPESASACEFDSMPKRRVASFEDGATVPLMVDTTTAKRRRLSASQEAEPRGVGFTPRYSREPPSPFDSVHATDPTRKRATTPFAYATPHSGINLASHVPLCGDGDTVRDSEPYDSQGEDDDDGEEWNGMDVAPIELSLPDELDEDDEDDMDEEQSR